jgi:hypothetical protein
MGISRNEKGISLVSVLVAIGLTGVLGLILMSLSEQQMKQQKKALVEADLSDAINQIRVIMTKKVSCNATFIGKKKGQPVFRLLKDTDPDTAPYAEVSDTFPFRGTKILLTNLRVLTDEEVANLGRTVEEGVVILDAEFRRPGNVLGGQTIRKQIDLPVVYGREELIYHPISESGVVSLCKSQHGNKSFIKSLTSGERANPEESGVYPRALGFEGMCVIPDTIGTTFPDSIINHCLTVN